MRLRGAQVSTCATECETTKLLLTQYLIYHDITIYLGDVDDSGNAGIASYLTYKHTDSILGPRFLVMCMRPY
jgi:hypothetical protein